ncbi:hypothetical protein [Streptomyces sp. SD15]
MNTWLAGFTGVMIGMILLGRRARRTAARAEAGEAVFFQVRANLPDKGRRYSLGRVQAGGEFGWKPRRSWTRLRELPTDLRYIRARDMTFLESLRLPPDMRVIECESSLGPVRLCARIEYTEHIVEMIRRTSSLELVERLGS